MAKTTTAFYTFTTITKYMWIPFFYCIRTYIILTKRVFRVFASTHPSNRLPSACISALDSHTTSLDHSLVYTQILKIPEGRSPNGHQWIS